MGAVLVYVLLIHGAWGWGAGKKHGDDEYGKLFAYGRKITPPEFRQMFDFVSILSIVFIRNKTFCVRHDRIHGEVVTGILVGNKEREKTKVHTKTVKYRRSQAVGDIAMPQSGVLATPIHERSHAELHSSFHVEMMMEATSSLYSSGVSDVLLYIYLLLEKNNNNNTSS